MNSSMNKTNKMQFKRKGHVTCCDCSYFFTYTAYIFEKFLYLKSTQYLHCTQT